jgi:long-chain acyl-CoA synthetase
MKHKDYPYYETTVFENFRVMVENVANKYPDRCAIAYKNDPHDENTIEITYEQARQDMRNYGTALVALGCREKHCAIIGASSYGWIYSYFTLMSIGAVTVPIDKELPIPDMESILETSECEYIFYGKAIKDKIDEIKKINKFAKHYICMDGDLEELLNIQPLIEHGKQLFEAGDNTYYDYVIDPDRLATIVFTSGTTGSGKGVMLTQTNIVTNMTQAMYLFNISRNTVSLLPPHHTYCSTVNFVGHYAQGCRIYISSGLKYMLKELKEQQPTHLILVPLFVETIHKRIWQTAEKQGKAKLLRFMMKVSNGMRKVGLDVRRKLFASVLDTFGGKLEMIICGGAALNQDIINTFDAMGITVLNGYGITECSPLISCNRNEYQKKGSVGRPIIGELVKIGNPNDDGEGEICVKGSNVMLGYYKNEEATKAAFDEEGYFKTGDFGRLDEDGWIYITGRIKNLIILSNGKNVYPEEIENEISRIYGVNEVVVYAGESKNKNKEVIVAEIYPDTEALQNRGITDLQKYFNDEVKKVNDRSVSYKAVHLIKIRDTEFQKNTSKKITRFKIDKSID